jgi:oxidase EvaA
MNPTYKGQASSGALTDISLSSSFVADRHITSTEAVLEWLQLANRGQPVRINRLALDALTEWHFLRDPLRFAHKSGKFFEIQGVRMRTDYGCIPCWDQPIINQPEIGILGLITKVFEGTRYFLMQAKAEPGNLNGIQLSPTLQATRSNYTMVHRGRPPRYLSYFTQHIDRTEIINQLHSEQASRFLRKRNLNVIVEPHGDVPVADGFRWLTLQQIKRLLLLDNVVNMDARSVLSCIPFPTWGEVDVAECSAFGESLLRSASGRARPLNTLSAIVNWFSLMRARYQRIVETRGLDVMDSWSFNNGEIRHESGRYFSVIGVQVEIQDREVVRWTQPLIHHNGRGLNALVVQNIGGVLHFLLRACCYPGSLEIFELGSTVSCSDYSLRRGRSDAPPFMSLFDEPDPRMVRFASLQSEEGGRFYHYENQYKILETPAESIIDLPEGYIWLTLGQIQHLLPHGYFNIEARNLLACLQII